MSFPASPTLRRSVADSRSFVLNSLGLIILEAAGNVVLPDNGPSWHKLRQNDFSDVDLSRLSPELTTLLYGMLDHSPDRRLPIYQVDRHPVVAFLKRMLLASLDVAPDVAPPVLGAIMPEADSFMSDLFAAVYPPPALGTVEEGMDIDE